MSRVRDTANILAFTTAVSNEVAALNTSILNTYAPIASPNFTGSITSSGDINLASGKKIKVNGTDLVAPLSAATTLQTNTSFSQIPYGGIQLNVFSNQFYLAPYGFFTSEDAAIFNAAFPVGSVVTATSSTATGTFTVASAAFINGGGYIIVPITTSEPSTIYFGFNGTATLTSGVSSSGKYLTNNGTSTSWESVSGYQTPTIGSTLIQSGTTVSTLSGVNLNNTISSATVVSNVHVSITKNGDIVRSADNGVSWTKINFPNEYFLSIAYGNGIFVVATAIKSYVSTDGLNWTSSASNLWFISDYYPAKMAYGSGKFVLTSGSPYVYYSTDGINWTTGNCGISAGFIVYGDSGFVVTESQYPWNKNAYSVDGITWTVNTDLPNIFNSYNVAFGNGHYVATQSYYQSGFGSGNTSQISTNAGVSWTQGGNLPQTDFWQNITYAMVGTTPTFVVAGYNGNVAYSTNNGTTWTAASGVPLGNKTRAISYINGKFIIYVTTYNYDAEIYTSINGQTWTQLSNAPISTNYGMYIGALGASYNLYTSSGTFNIAGSSGTNGQALTSTGTGYKWTSLVDNLIPDMVLKKENLIGYSSIADYNIDDISFFTSNTSELIIVLNSIPNGSYVEYFGYNLTPSMTFTKSALAYDNGNGEVKLPVSNKVGNIYASTYDNPKFVAKMTNGKYLTNDGIKTSWVSVTPYVTPTLGSTPILSGTTTNQISDLQLQSPALYSPYLNNANIVGASLTFTQIENPTFTGTVTVSGDINLSAVGGPGNIKDELALLLMGAL